MISGRGAFLRPADGCSVVFWIRYIASLRSFQEVWLAGSGILVAVVSVIMPQKIPFCYSVLSIGACIGVTGHSSSGKYDGPWLHLLGRLLTTD